MSLELARREGVLASSGGAPFLIAFSLTLGLTGVAAFWLDVKVVALITLFQGNVALPLAFWLERRMSEVRMSDHNPLKPLAIQLAMSQVLALPAVLFVYALMPAAVPAAMAGVGAAHFLPYAWLHGTRWYVALAVVVAIVPAALTVMLRQEAPPFVLLSMAVTYVIVAVQVRRYARTLIMA